MNKEGQKTNQIIILGDCNARIRNDQNRNVGCRGQYGEHTLNRNGIKMLDFCIINDLLLEHTYWQ